MSYKGKCPTCRTDTMVFEHDSPFKCANGMCADLGKAISKEVAMNQLAQAKQNPKGLAGMFKDDEGLGSDRVLEARMRLALEALETDWAVRDKKIGELYREMESLRHKHSDLKSLNSERYEAIKQAKAVITSLTQKRGDE